MRIVTDLNINELLCNIVYVQKNTFETYIKKTVPLFVFRQSQTRLIITEFLRVIMTRIRLIYNCCTYLIF